MHANELPLRAALIHYLGKTKGLDKHVGPISTAIHDPGLTDLPIEKFCKIQTQFPKFEEEVHKDLSTDQLYLYDICQGIISGKVDSDLAAHELLPASFDFMSPPKLLPNNLKAIVNIIVKFYTRMWFPIKSHANATDGPRNLFTMIELVKGFPIADQILLKKRIQHNAYYAHLENILLTMLTDNDQDV